MSKPKSVMISWGGDEEIPKRYGILKIACAYRKRFNGSGYYIFRFGKGNIIVLVGWSFDIILNTSDQSKCKR